ncbi:hypothetical protein [Streptacidiphilus sp. PAMC 29251]
MSGIRALPAAGLRVLDSALVRMMRTEHRLIGLALLRIVIGAATILYCLSDYSSRQFFWGPDSYNSAHTASAALPARGFSLFLLSNSQLWFELLFHLVILVSALFMVFGGRALTIAQAVLMWSLHNRNQDILEGGDNLAQILIIFMVLTVTNGYFAPGAKARRARLLSSDQPQLSTAVHNLGAYLIVFQVAIVYFVSGYWKIAGTIWQQGTAMYYISRISGFDMSGTYAHLMGNAFIGTGVCYVTIFIELAFPFAILSGRAWIRKAQAVSLEGMHLGIMLFMGLVCFGLIMIGADCTGLRDEDYRSLWRQSIPLRRRIGGLLRPDRALAVRSPLADGD